LDLDTSVDAQPPIADTVTLFTEVVGARVGYVELYRGSRDATVFRYAYASEGVAKVDVLVSRDIIREAIETRTTINLASAIDHPRFRTCPNVVANGIRAVMCAPIGIGAPAGVVYVQGRRSPGRFPDVDRERIELFAAKLAPIADRVRFGPDASKVTLDDELRWLEHRYVRASLDRNRGNLTTTARDLGVTRARLYRILKRSL
jgi:signal transduction protein with GAF and PtsI domain